MLRQELIQRYLMTTTADKLKMLSHVGHFIRFCRQTLGLKNKINQVERKGLFWNLDLREGIDLCLFLYGSYEKEVETMYQRMIKEDYVILDIGANIGAHTLPMSSLVGPNGKLFAFEPTIFASKKLKMNLDLNPSLRDRVQVQQIYLTDSETNTIPETLSSSWDIEKPIEDRSRNKLDKGFAQSTLGAELKTLDTWAIEKEVSRIDLIKLDVDGGEVEVLKGAIKTIQKFKPRILIELSPIHFEGHKYSFNDQIQLLRKLNYRLEDVFGNTIPMDTEYLMNWIPWGTLINVIALPNLDD